jgi:ribonuclease HII
MGACISHGVPKVREKRAQVAARHRELLEIESALWLHGLNVAGLDEAGAGPLAGPVVAACVVLDRSAVDDLRGVDDSKACTEARRNELAAAIREKATAAAIAEASVEEIDRLNIRQAGRLAMQRALEAVAGELRVDHLLVDARTVPGVHLPQSSIVKGDSRSLSIAAASILAKVARDALMVEAASSFPGFGFDRHKGYGTKEHLLAIERLGLTPLHRRSFAPVRQAEEQLALFS